MAQLPSHRDRILRESRNPKPTCNLLGSADSQPPRLPNGPCGVDEILSDEHKVADDLARLAARPEMFTKAEMADLMKRAAQKMQRDERVLASMKEVLSAAIFEREVKINRQASHDEKQAIR